jgi:hypothetical protein
MDVSDLLVGGGTGRWWWYSGGGVAHKSAKRAEHIVQGA